MKLSVIMPCFNVSTFLGKALSSLVTQTFSNLEIICVDDGSTDETAHILSSFAKHDDRIRVISKVNEKCRLDGSRSFEMRVFRLL